MQVLQLLTVYCSRVAFMFTSLPASSAKLDLADIASSAKQGVQTLFYSLQCWSPALAHAAEARTAVIAERMMQPCGCVQSCLLLSSSSCCVACIVTHACCAMLCCVVSYAGQPPKRLQGSEDENIQDVMARVEKVAEDRENDRLAHDPQMQELAKKQEKMRHSENSDHAADV